MCDVAVYAPCPDHGASTSQNHSGVIWPAGEGIEQAIREHGESFDMMLKQTHDCVALHIMCA